MNKCANRITYGKTLVQLAADNEFYVMDADLSKATGTKAFANAYPQRFINMGIAEQDLMATAAGIASCGVPVFASTFAMFDAGRAYEQIRNSITYPRANVKIVCSHAGVLIGEDGASHQCIEDLSLMRTLPGMTVLAPCDSAETAKALAAALKLNGPCYIRFGRQEVDQIYDDTLDYQIGKSFLLRKGGDVSIIACGELVQNALQAASLLSEKGIEAAVIDMHTIKPLDEAQINECIDQGSLLVGVEDHSVIGGLSSAIAEVIAQRGKGRLLRIGIQDEFGCSGNADYLAKLYRLTPEAIAETIQKELKV